MLLFYYLYTFTFLCMYLWKHLHSSLQFTGWYVALVFEPFVATVSLLQMPVSCTVMNLLCLGCPYYSRTLVCWAKSPSKKIIPSRVTQENNTLNSVLLLQYSCGRQQKPQGGDLVRIFPWSILPQSRPAGKMKHLVRWYGLRPLSSLNFPKATSLPETQHQLPGSTD